MSSSLSLVSSTNQIDSHSTVVDFRYQNIALPVVPDFKGKYNFSLNINSCEKLEFSPELNRLFVLDYKTVNLNFKINRNALIAKGLVVRAMAVYCDLDHISEPVKRCKIHMLEDDPNNEAHADKECYCTLFKLAGHVLRSRSKRAIYGYENISQRHSVALKIKDMFEKNKFKAGYYFACKSSCLHGMQRRLIKVVFTLENQTGEVFGQSSIEVKVCSSPKRDKERVLKCQKLRKHYDTAADGHCKKKIRVQLAKLQSFTKILEDFAKIIEKRIEDID